MDERKYLNEMYSSVLERTIRRLWVLCIILILSLISVVFAWVYTNSQYETTETTTTVTQDLESDGDAIINDGVHIDGKSKTDSNN